MINYLIFILIFISASLVRLWGLGESSFFQDELALLLHQSFSFSKIMEFSINWGFHPPLYYFYLKTWTSLFGISEWISRLSSVIPSIFLCVVPYFYRKVIPFHYAYLSLMLVFSFPIIYWTQVVDPYSLALLFFLNATFLLWKLMLNEQARIWPIITLASLCFYTHYASGLMIFVLIGVFCVISRLSNTSFLFRRLLKIEVIFGMICLPWFVVSKALRAMPIGKDMHFWNAATDQLNQLKEVISYLFSGSPYLVVLFCFCIIIILLKSRKKMDWIEWGFFLSILLFIALIYVRSLHFNSALIPRFFIWLVPLIYLLLLFSVKDSSPKLIIVTISFLVLEAFSPTRMNFRSTQDIRGAMKELTCHPKPILLVFNPEWFKPYSKHLSTCSPTHIHMSKCANPQKLLEELPANSASFFLWLDCASFLDYIRQLDPPPGELKSFEGAFIFYKK